MATAKPTTNDQPDFSRERSQRLQALARDVSVHFPMEKLQKQQHPERTPVVLLSCGSFSPITFMHLRMFGK